MPISKPIQISPNDLNPSMAIGVNIPFNKPGVFTSNYTTKDSIRNNLINFFLTNPGERPLNPNFGGGLREFIFQQLSDGTLEVLTQDVESKIQNKFPRLNVIDLQIFESSTYTITVYLKYSVNNTDIVDSITVDFNK